MIISHVEILTMIFNQSNKSKHTYKTLNTDSDVIISQFIIPLRYETIEIKFRKIQNNLTLPLYMLLTCMKLMI